MTENGQETRGSIWKDVAEQMSDHVDLAALELRFEARQAAKLLWVAGVVLILVLTAFIVLQVAIVGALMRAGLSMGLAALLLSALYVALALAVYGMFGRRDKRMGPPFIGTQTEMRETLRWIQKIFS